MYQLNSNLYLSISRGVVLCVCVPHAYLVSSPNPTIHLISNQKFLWSQSKHRHFRLFIDSRTKSSNTASAVIDETNYKALTQQCSCFQWCWSQQCPRFWRPPEEWDGCSCVTQRGSSVPHPHSPPQPHPKHASSWETSK